MVWEDLFVGCPDAPKIVLLGLFLLYVLVLPLLDLTIANQWLLLVFVLRLGFMGSIWCDFFIVCRRSEESEIEAHIKEVESDRDGKV